MDDLARAHIEWLKALNDRSTETIRSRIRVLSSLPNAGTATREQVEAWWEDRARKVTKGTRAVDLSHIKQFYHWCQIYDHRADDPSIRIRPIRVHQQPAAKAHTDDIRALLDDRTLGSDLKRAVMLGAFAGLRIAETAALMWSDVDDDTDTITVRHGKGDKPRLVDASPLLLDKLGARKRGCNVVTGTEEVLTADRLRRRLNRAMKQRGIDNTSHALRHWYGMMAYQTHGDILAVAELMGHSNTKVTMRYARASNDVKKKIASAVMRQFEDGE